MGMSLYQLIKDRHDIVIRMFDGVEPHAPIPLDEVGQIGGDKLAELTRTQKWANVEAVIRA